ncbi:MAG: recombination protein NinB, partial [Gallionellaceae bacterium]|nr:recombination protein NinB [Gallionellaceae bacterium]
MSDVLRATLFNAQQGHSVILNAWDKAKAMLIAGHRLTLELRPEKRSNEQNRRMWAMLTDISRQVEWHGQRLSPEDWKHVFSAGLKKQRAVPGIDGGFVVLGLATSRMTKAEMSELQELMAAFGAEHGVTFHDGFDDGSWGGGINDAPACAKPVSR